ncbi:molecular chaperone HtpG [bacterium]|nr:molecular chaperone HtpG [bacterium]
MTTQAAPREFAFQAEIQQVLHLLAHSLYQSKEIALRELISNASDALDKYRHVCLVEEPVKDPGDLSITLIPDPTANTLTIADNGIGMTEEELIAHLGTIAKSGSRDFLSSLQADAKKAVNLIGQFGVGFYSAFMLAHTVEVRSRSYQSDQAYRWTSDGSGKFTVEPIDGLDRGTQIVLHLKDDLKEFTFEHRLKSIVQTYSRFVPHPIRLNDVIINDVKPIWVEPKSQLSEEQYAGFFEHLTHQTGEKPIWHLHYSTDSPIQFHALLYCPASNPERLGFGRAEHGLNLCAKRILVQNDCRDLLPEYLRFLHGVVDSEDLPLNVSRETLQDNSVFQKIRRVLVRKILDRLSDLSKEQPAHFAEFTQQFGNSMKEGVGSDFENREKLAALWRFPSTRDDHAEPTSLDAYIERMKPDQQKIFFLAGSSLKSLARHPHLEIFRQRGTEVLLLPEPIDEWAVLHLAKYREHEFQSVDASNIDLPPKTEEAKETSSSSEADATGFGRVIEIFKRRLGEKVAEIRRSDRLIDSPCCLVSADGNFSPQLQKMMMLANKEFDMPKRIFEINPRAKLIKRLADLSANPSHEEFIGKVGEQLFLSSLLLEGMLLEPENLAQGIQAFMEEAAQGRSPIITG